MLGWILKISIMSIIFIFLVHHLIIFFTSMLTIPKIKNVMNYQTDKYKQILETITNNNIVDENSNSNSNSNSYTDICLLPETNLQDINNDNININNMKDELKNFLKGQ